MTAAAASRERGLRVDVKTSLVRIGAYFAQPYRLIKDYDRADFRPDLVAGLTVAVILLPQAIAFALLAELPPAMGIYAAVIGGLAGALWGSSRQANTGPTNAISLLVLSTLSGIAIPGTPEYIIAAGMLAVMVGLVQLLLGLASLGLLVNFVSHSVIVGFATGAGVLIAVKQLGPLLGISVSGESVSQTLVMTVSQIPEANTAAAAIGIGTILFIVVAQRINAKLPAALLAMIIAATLVFALNLIGEGVVVIGDLPKGFPPSARLPLFNIDLWRQMTSGALAVAAISLVETTAISRSVATQTGQRLNSNQEFVGQGMANIAAGLFSGFPVAGSFSRTAVNFRAGAKTQLAALLASGFVLLATLALSPYARFLPVSALAGVLIVTAWRMIDKAEIIRILRGSRGDALIMLVTFFGTLLLHLETAVLAGIVLSVIRYIVRTSTPRVHAVVPDKRFRHFEYAPDRDQCTQLSVVEILGDLYFGAVNHVEEFILRHSTNQRFLLLRMHNVNNCDFAGIHMLESVVRHFREHGGDVYLVRVGYRVRERMEKTGFDRLLGLDHFVDEDEAIAHLFYRVLDPAVCIYECPVRVFRECQNLPKRLDLMDANWRTDLPDAHPMVIGAHTLWDNLHAGKGEAPYIVDVREPREYHGGHIPEARSIPLTLLPDNADQLPDNQEIIFVCRSGRRSRRAAQMLAAKLGRDVTVLDGGMIAWETDGLLTAIDTYNADEES